MKRFVYADNAATTPLSEKALEAMLPFLKQEYGNASQPYSFSRLARKTLKEARATIAQCIGASPEEIFFTSGGTESDNWVIQGAMHQGWPIISSSIEHHAVLKPCEFAKKRGCKVELLPVSHEGVVSVGTLAHYLTEDKGLVSVMFANNEIGSIQPVEVLARLAHDSGWLFHTDAVQAVGHVPIDVQKLGMDMLSASAHKFNGPKGMGFLYIRNGIEWPSLILGGSQESEHRAGTENVAGIVGMAVALQENIDMLDANTKHICRLEESLLDKLSHSGVRFYRNGAKHHITGNISLSFPGHSGEAILHRLDLKGISISTGSACDSHDTQMSHVLKAIRLEEELAKSTIRISFGRYNIEEDVSILANALIQIVSKRNL